MPLQQFDDARFLRLFIDSVVDYALLSLDLEGRISSWNAGASRLKGYSAEEILGQHFSIFYTPEDRASGLPAELLEQAKQNNHTEHRGWRIRKDGTRFWGDVVISAVRDENGTLVGYGKVTRDLTERKAAEEREHQLTIDLERANRMKSEFLAHMSHEIRTPLNGIIGMLTLLHDTELKVEQRYFADTASQSAEALIRIVNDILDVSKVEAGKLELERVPFSISEVVHGTSQLLSPQAEHKGLDLNVMIGKSLPPLLVGDPGRLRQIITNLVNNALKFTTDGFVSIRVSPTKRSGDEVEVRFEVEDTGIGMKQEDQERLFGAFSQAEQSTTRRYGGTGLGLTISRQLVELMGGQLSVQSTVGQGSTFRFDVTFPTIGNDVLSKFTDTIDLNLAKESLGGMPIGDLAGRLLVAEDNEINRQVIHLFLQRLGLEHTIVENGEDALKLLTQESFDLVLMDCHMPILDGFETTRRIRQTEGQLAEIPIVAVTASALPEEMAKCLTAGMNDVVSKPIVPAELQRVLRRWLQHQQANH